MIGMRAISAALLGGGLLISWPSHLQSKPSLSGPALEFRNLQAGPAKLVDGARFGIGNAQIKFTGRFAPLAASGVALGYFLEGQGVLTYRATFGPAAPVFRRIVKEWCGLETTVGGTGETVDIPFTSARVLWAGTHLEAWNGPPSDDLGRQLRDFSERSEKIVGFAPFDQLALQAINAADKPLALIELEQGSKKWIYQFDGVDGLEESLGWIYPYKGQLAQLRDRLFIARLSRQSINRDPRKDPPPLKFQITALDIDLRTKDNRTAEIVLEETVVPLEDGLKLLQFHLQNEVITHEDTRKLNVEQVTDRDGHALVFAHTGNRLLVRLESPTRRGNAVNLRFTYKGEFLIQPKGDNYWELPVRGGWYPAPESLRAESYLFHGTVRTVGQWIAFLPGETVRRGKEGEWNLIETRTSQPVGFATILGGKYFLDEETQDGLTVRVATYGYEPGPGNRIVKAQAFNVVRYYERFLGPFPFKEFQIVQRNDMGGGQAPPSMMYITKEAFDQIGGVRRLQEFAQLKEALRQGRIQTPLPDSPSASLDIRHIFAHEIAHQYWGIMVKWPSPEEQWISESFAEYCAALFERDYKGKHLFQKHLEHWESGAKDSLRFAPIPLANDFFPKDGREQFQVRQDLLYGKGPMVLHSLHKELGEQVFLTWLSSIQANFRWRFTQTWQLFDLLKFMTKKDYTAFLDKYFWGYDLPPR